MPAGIAPGAKTPSKLSSNALSAGQRKSCVVDSGAETGAQTAIGLDTEHIVAQPYERLDAIDVAIGPDPGPLLHQFEPEIVGKHGRAAIALVKEHTTFRHDSSGIGKLDTFGQARNIAVGIKYELMPALDEGGDADPLQKAELAVPERANLG
jgi:hypothetical protein